MELRYPYLIIIGLIIITFVLFLFKKKHHQFNGGIKLANTQYLKNSLYYKKILKRYKFMMIFIKVSCWIAILTSLYLIARPTVTKTSVDEKYNRDIILCMDVSTSVNNLNYQLVDNLKEIVKKLKGERFGISIFNTSSVTLVPLTEDYDYVTSVLDQIKKSIDAYNNDIDGDNFFYNFNYLFSGTLENNETRGSSLIGDGLASCIYNFSSKDDERTKIIIFSTDNDLAGTPLLTLDEATTLGKRKNVIIYGIGPKYGIVDKENFKTSIEKTGGFFYDSDVYDVSEIVRNIEKQSKSIIRNKVIKTKIDNPLMPFILLILSSSVMVILNKKVII